MSMIQLQHAVGHSDIHSEAGLLDNVARWRALVSGQALVVTDQTVAALYLDRLQTALASIRYDTLILPPGEAHKTLGNWRKVLNKLADMAA
ncbi:MAG: hypothetical protein AAF446_12065, partial [Pseudomonadota bacterium]